MVAAVGFEPTPPKRLVAASKYVEISQKITILLLFTLFAAFNRLLVF